MCSICHRLELPVVPSSELPVPWVDVPVDKSQRIALAADAEEGALSCRRHFDHMMGRQTSVQVFVAYMGLQEGMELAA